MYRDVIAQISVKVKLSQATGGNIGVPPINPVVIVEPDLAPDGVAALRTVGARIEAVASRAAHGIEHEVLTAVQVIAVALLQLFMTVIVAGYTKITTRESLAKRCAHARNLAARLRRLRRVRIKRGAIALLGDEIDDAGHSIRTINRRCAIFENFDSLERRNGYDIEVE